jgi:SnoaL-like domain
MSVHTAISPAGAADRLAIRELIEAYAHSADQTDIPEMLSLFSPHPYFALYFDVKDPKPFIEADNRDSLAAEFGRLNHFEVTHHFIGQSTIRSLTAERGTGETYCLAHHLSVAEGRSELNLAAIRYIDAFVKLGGAWRFAERRLYFDWIEDRAVGDSAASSLRKGG